MAKGNAPLTEAQWQKKWQAEEDARALQRAAEIQGDPKRIKAAQAQIKQELADLKKREKAMQAVVTTPAKKTTTPRGAKKK